MSITPFAPIPSAMAEIQSAFAMLAPPTTSVTGASSSPPAATDPFSVLLDAAQTASTATASATTAEPTTTSDGISTTSAYTPLSSSVYSLGTSALSSASGGSASGAAIVAEAAKQIGVPYVWGGTSPTQGFDCSGLVQYTFSQLGISLPRTAAQQEQVGTPVASLAEAQPGDLLFFEPGENGAPAGEAGHVAIYIGNNEMIAAPETGEDVQVQTVPGTPLAIRRITDTNATDAPSTAASTATSGTAGTGSVQMGNVSVPSAYAGLVEQASASTGTPASFLAAILQQESGYNPDAVSPTGAEGIAQFEPGTAASNGVSPFDPSSAIPGAANLLAQYHSLFGSWSLAAAAYNAGVGAVEETGGIPQNGQTPAYVQNVIAMSGLGAGGVSAGAVALAATAPRTPSSGGSVSPQAASAVSGATDDAATPSFADMLDKASPNLSGNAHGSSPATGDAPSAQARPAATGDARYAAARIESAQSSGHVATAKRTTPPAGPPAAAGAHDEVTPGEAAVAVAVTGASDATEPSAVLTAAVAGTERTGAAGVTAADAAATPTGSSPRTSSSLAPGKGPETGQVAALRGAATASTETGEATADALGDAAPTPGTLQAAKAAETPQEAAVVASSTPPASSPSGAGTPASTRRSSSLADGTAGSPAPAPPSVSASSTASGYGALGTGSAEASAGDVRQAATRPTRSDDSPATPALAANPAAASAAAPMSASSRAAQSSSGVEYHVTSLDDPPLPSSGFVGNNSVLTATISQPKNLGDGVYQLHAALNPPALGHVDATVRVDGANVEVVLVAHTAEGHQQLAANLDQLRTALNQGGGGGDVQLSLSERGRQQTPQQPASDASTPDIASETDLSREHLLVSTPVASARSSLHIIL